MPEKGEYSSRTAAIEVNRLPTPVKISIALILFVGHMTDKPRWLPGGAPFAPCADGQGPGTLSVAARLLECAGRLATGYSKKAQQMVQSRAIQTMLVATISIFALTIAAVGDQAIGESSLDTSYIISFARVPVGEITASLVLGNTEYKISARGRAGGMVKVLLDGEGSFTTQGTNVDGGLEPKRFTSKIVSNKGTSEVSMAFDGDSVKELVAETRARLGPRASDRDEPASCL